MALKKIDFYKGCPYQTDEGMFYYAADVEPILNNIKQLKAEILPFKQRTKQCACADNRGSIKELLEHIDAKLSAV
jgi:hypothetical protein